jgi:hypothetical protein
MIVTETIFTKTTLVGLFVNNSYTKFHENRISVETKAEPGGPTETKRWRDGQTLSRNTVLFYLVRNAQQRATRKGVGPPAVNQFTEPSDTRSGAYVTAQIVTICRTSQPIIYWFFNSGKITNDLRVTRSLFSVQYKWGTGTTSYPARAVPRFKARKSRVTGRSPT